MSYTSKKGKLILGPNNCDKDINYKYDKGARSNCYYISGTKTFCYSKMDEIRDPFFVVQVYHKTNDTVAIGLNIKDVNNTISKFTFTSAERNSDKPLKSSSFYISIPIPDNNWVNVCFDLSKVANLKRVTFQSLTGFEITPTCYLHCAFSASNQLDPALEGSDLPRFDKCDTSFSGIKSVTVLVPSSIIPITSSSPVSSSSGKRQFTGTSSSKRASSKIPIFSPKNKKRSKQKTLESRDDGKKMTEMHFQVLHPKNYQNLKPLEFKFKVFQKMMKKNWNLFILKQ